MSSRPALLFIDAAASRRRGVGQGLSAHGYEVVPAGDAEGAVRFAAALNPQVVVLASSMLASSGQEAAPRQEDAPRQENGAPSNPLAAEVDRLRALGSRVVVLVDDEADLASVDDRDSAIIDVGQGSSELTLRLRLVLVGQEVGLDPDLELRSLVGDLALHPMLEVVRSLATCRFTGRMEIDDVGALAFEDGSVVAAAGQRVRGLKAFCRLARVDSGPFHLRLGTPGMDHNLDVEVPDLVLRALEETQIQLPDVDLRILTQGEPSSLQGSASNQDLLLEMLRHCNTVGELLDAWPATDGRIAQTLERLVEKGVLELQKPRMGVRVVTDSSADLPPDLVRSHDILVVPLCILFGEDRLRDGIDIGPRDFYQLLESGEQHPRTEPPTEGEFYEHFHDQIVEQDIFAVHISEKLSKTAEHARQAALKGSRTFDHLPPQRHNFALEVVDSTSVSMATGLQALFAARMARRGLKVFAIAQRLRQLQERHEILFVVDTLDYLVRGGRIGKAQAWVGKLLGIKPILGVVDGEVAAVDRARGGRQAQRRIVELLSQRLDVQRPVVMAVAHAKAPAWADRLSQLIAQRFEIREKVATDIGPVVGTHAGPGCVGCVVFQPTDEEWPLIAPLEGGA